MGETASAAVAAVLARWPSPSTGSPWTAPAYRALAEAATSIPFPAPIAPDEVERRVGLARRNREYSAAHVDAILRDGRPSLPGLLARAAELDAEERARHAPGLAEWERRRAIGEGAAADEDAALAMDLHALVAGLPPVEAAVLVLRFGLAGERQRRPDETANLLGVTVGVARAVEEAAIAQLRDRAGRLCLRQTSPPLGGTD
jgi:hypothetical protein